jgi:hypothetical protein
MISFFKSCILVFLLCSASSVFAQESNGAQQESIQIEEQEGASPSEELLAQQVALLERHNSELRSIVIWSLSFAATFLIGFLVLVGFLTVRRYEQDKASLHGELQAELKIATSEMKAELQSDRATLEADIATKEERLSGTLRETAENTAKKMFSNLESKIDSLNLDLDALKNDLLEKIAADEALNGSPAMAVTAYLRCAAHAQSRKDQYSLTRSLEKLEEQLSKGGYFSAHEKVEITRLLSAMPSEYQPLAESIRRLMSSEKE